MKKSDVVDMDEPHGFERLLLPLLSAELILLGIQRWALPPMRQGGYSLGEYLGILESGLAAAAEKGGKYGAEKWLRKEIKRTPKLPVLLPPQMVE